MCTESAVPGAGASGIAITFVDWADQTRWKVINNTLGLPFEQPEETYSTSPHLYHDLGIDPAAKGRIARSGSRTADRPDGSGPPAQPARGLVWTPPAPGVGYAMASLSSGTGPRRAHAITGLPATEPADDRRLRAGRASQPQRFPDHHEIAVVAAPVAVEVPVQVINTSRCGPVCLNAWLSVASAFLATVLTDVTRYLSRCESARNVTVSPS